MSEVEKYRCLVTAPDLVSARVRLRESNLLVQADRDLAREARSVLGRRRGEIEEYLYRNPEWGRSMVPIPERGDAPEIVRAMSRASAACGVGPMATVAGALAWFVGRELSARSGEVIVENGGDIYLDRRRERTILVWPGSGEIFPVRVGIKVPVSSLPAGVAASSGSFGRSLSWGKVAVAVVVAVDSLIADGAATALGNRVPDAAEATMETALESVMAIPGVTGGLVLCRGILAARGDIELVDLAAGSGKQDTLRDEGN